MAAVKRERPKICKLCETDLIPGFDTEHQKLLTVQTNQLELSAHFFCLAFSSGLGQRGEETEGLQGFLSSDVLNEIKRGSRLKCVYCKKKGATVGCARPQCKKSYHLPCGLVNNSLQQYFDQFKSFCSSHRPIQKTKSPSGSSRSPTKNKVERCSICQDQVSTTPSPRSIWTPCCGAFFHPACIQATSLSAGAYHFRCPLCNDEPKFLSEMKQFGIYVPERDASWEEHNSMDTNFTLTPECRAKICFCQNGGPDHRLYDSVDSSWEILGCHSCGIKGIHVRCGGLDEYVNPHWYCYICRRLEPRKRPGDDMSRDRPIVAIWGTAFAKKPEKETYLEAPTTVALPTETDNEKSPNFVTCKLPSATQVDLCKSYPATATNTTAVANTSAIPMQANIPTDFKLTVPIKRSSDLMNLTLEEIIVKGLDEKLRETNYQSKFYGKTTSTSISPPPSTSHLKSETSNTTTLRSVPVTSQSDTVRVVTFSVPVTKSDEKDRQKSLDSSNSPGDSDYESAQEVPVPFKIRKKSLSTEEIKIKDSAPVSVPTPPTVVIRQTGPVTNGLARERKLHLNQSDFIDQKIQNSIKEFFRETTSQ